MPQGDKVAKICPANHSSPELTICVEPLRAFILGCPI